MKGTNNKVTPARFIIAMLMLAVMIVQIPMQVLAQTDVFESPELTADALPAIETKAPSFKLASNHDAILYGYQKESYADKTYFFENGKLYVETDTRKTVLADEDGENINISNGKLYFTVFENGKAQIKAVDLESRKVSTVLSAGKEQIRNFYIVNDDTMLYLAGGIVYSCRIGAQKVERISPMDNVFSFIPTNSGNLYAAGELFNCSISLDNVHLLDKVSYYTVDLAKDHFVATVDGTLFQIPMAKLRGFCSKVIKEKAENTADLLPYMTEYDLYGTYDAVDLLRLNDESRICEHCESEEPHTHREESLSEAELKGVGAYATVPLSNASRMIMSQSNSLTQYTWTPKADVHKYKSQYFVSSECFEMNQPVTGIPYTREAIFSRFASSFAPYVKYIVYGYNKPNLTEEWTTKAMSFANFKDWIGNRDSKFYGEAANTAPLYGTDCSGFAAYCWGVKKKLGSQEFGGGDENGVYYCTALNVTNQSSLSLLQVGDVFAKAYDHVIMISDIAVKPSGQVIGLEVTEETPPITKKSIWPPDDFVSTYIDNGYYAYRPKTYKVTFKGNGGVVSTPNMFVIANVPYGSGNGLPTATRSGYNFLGWYTAATGGTMVTNSDCSGAAARTLYAHWVDNGLIQGAGDCILPQAGSIFNEDEK
ncbi:MAG: InlB B-repeat-containing protein [Clostridia bacterium]|nr:InlB B-repeat-containing protein [Clostridia bacterium]